MEIKIESTHMDPVSDIDTEKKKLYILSVLFIALFTSMLGIGIIVPVLPLYAEKLGASGFLVGLIFSGFSISRFLVMPIVGKLSDQMGRKVFIAAGLFLYSLISLSFILATGTHTLILVRFGQGVAAAMIVPISLAYVGEIAPKNAEGKYMGILSTALFTGFGTGPFMGGILTDLYGIETCFFALSALTFFAFSLVCIFLPELHLYRKSRSLSGTTFIEMIRSQAVGSLLFFRFTTAMGRGAIVAFLPIFAYNKLHLSATYIGALITGNILITSLFQLPFGLLADKLSRKKLIIVGGCFFSVLICIFPLVKTFSQLLVVSILYGIFGALALPAATAIMVDQGKIFGMGSSMSLFNMSMSLGLAVGPLLAGWVADFSGIDFVFYFFSVLGCLGIVFFAINFKE